MISTFTLAALLLTIAAPPPSDPPKAPKRLEWNGFERLDFIVDGRAATLIVPPKADVGKPWIWRTEFFGHEPQADIALVGKGFHVAYVNVQNLYGAPKALDAMDKFYEHVTREYGLMPKVALEGFSRGGLFALNWAARHPERVACIYNDAPVCDFKSWPGGKGKGKGSAGDWKRCLEAYGLTEAEALAYKLNPVDNLAPLVKHKIPLLHVCGDADDVVPFEENTKLIETRYKELGGPITVIVKPGVGHHPHSLKDPQPIVDFVCNHTAALDKAPPRKVDATQADGAASASPIAHRVLGSDNGRIAILGRDGVTVEWEFKNGHQAHDLQVLPSGNILLPTSPTKIVELTPAKEIVWQYEALPTGENKGRVEVHAFQRLADGKTMVAESGNGRIVELDAAGKVVFEMKLTRDKPNAHKDTRLARKLASGNYLVCHEADGAVREYEPSGKVVWTYKLDLAGRPKSGGHGPEGHGTDVYGAVRLTNGNTLIACGNGNRVIEVTPEGKTVWSIDQDELPGIKLAWVTTLHVLPGGNVIVGNCHAGKDVPQLFEVTRDKKVVWQLNNFKTFGNGWASAHVLDLPEATIR
jgi:pimeloyl-ACP methyl ester carboxylesterase/outer membrane protein assembly factor BamB